MNAFRLFARIAVVAAIAAPAFARGAEPAAPEPPANYARTPDVIYGRRDGHALTLDVFAPKGKGNGAGLILCVSAKYRSGPELFGLVQFATDQFVDRGYVVFAVTHGSQPKYTVPEIVEDVHRAVRFVRANAGKYGVDPERLGITGGSSGGHLALMMGCAGRDGDAGAKDPVERQSSKVAAVACFFPPTDFVALEGKCPKDVGGAFDFREPDPATGKSVPVSPERAREIAVTVSPITHASKGAAPTLIVHGDQDTMVPIEQSKALIGKLKWHRVDCELVIKEGRGHYWFGMDKDVPTLIDWFDKHLLARR